MGLYREGDKFDMTIAEGDCIPQVCDDCSEPLCGKGHVTGDNEGVVCSDCFDHYMECPRCGVVVHQDEIGGSYGWCEICRGD